MPVINRATIKLAKFGEQAEMTVPISDMMPPSRIPYFLDMRSDTWPLDKDDTADERSIEATYIPCCVEDRWPMESLNWVIWVTTPIEPGYKSAVDKKGFHARKQCTCVQAIEKTSKRDMRGDEEDPPIRREHVGDEGDSFSAGHSVGNIVGIYKLR